MARSAPKAIRRGVPPASSGLRRIAGRYGRTLLWNTAHVSIGGLRNILCGITSPPSILLFINRDCRAFARLRALALLVLWYWRLERLPQPITTGWSYRALVFPVLLAAAWWQQAIPR